MNKQVDTSGGAYVEGSITAGGNFVGRDQTNIIIVGRFLEFAQIESLLPPIDQNSVLNSYIDALEEVFSPYDNENLLKATSFAGSILANFFSEKLGSSDQPVNLIEIVSALPDHIGEQLERAGYWQAISQRSYSQYESTLWLNSTNALFQKYSNQAIQFSIGKKKPSDFFLVTSDIELPNSRQFQKLSLADVDGYSTLELRILISGIVLDLIRIAIEDSANRNLLNELRKQLNQHTDADR